MRRSERPTLAPVTEAVVRFTTLLPEDRISDTALRMARVSLFDWLAVAVAGQEEAVSRIVREYVAADGGVEEATVFGLPDRLPARAAALANGTISHALDYDDTHFAYLGHPSVAVFPAAFALAQKTGATGARFLAAALIGMEAATRIGAWLGRDHHLVGFHSTATAGTFGATVAAARLLGLDETEAGHALGLAASRAAGLRAQFGTMGKPFHAGMAASSGVEAACLAQAGFQSRPDALETDQGFAITHGAEMRDPQDVLNGLGDSWMFEGVLHKFHACCHGAHAALEALTEARDRLDVAPDAVANVSLAVPERYLKVCNILAPKTGMEAKFSYRLCAAMILAGRDTAALSTFSDDACRDAELRSLRDRVEVTGQQGLAETEATVRITTTDGRSAEATHDIDRPVTLETREQKIQAKARALLGARAASDLWNAVASADPRALDNWLRTAQA